MKIQRLPERGSSGLKRKNLGNKCCPEQGRVHPVAEWARFSAAVFGGGAECDESAVTFVTGKRL